MSNTLTTTVFVPGEPITAGFVSTCDANTFHALLNYLCGHSTAAERARDMLALLAGSDPHTFVRAYNTMLKFL